jgi:medium-chain acyl-[acyl-carrier-protein] hydrolase
MILPKTDTCRYRVDPFDDDFTGRLSWNVLGKHVLACAEHHAGARGFDKFERDGHRYLWVLSRMVFEMEKWPRIGEDYAITTWVRRYYRYFTDRCFEVLDAEGNVIGRVFTIWAMIDGETRRPQVLGELFGHTFDPYVDMEHPFPQLQPGRCKVSTETPAYVRRAFYTDIDENDHVNSIRYIEFVLDAFPKDYFARHEVKHLEMAYNNESYSGDELSVFVEKQAAGDAYNVIIRKNGGETVCHSAVEFRPAEQELKDRQIQ